MKNNNPRVAIRVDATSIMGTGHVGRCLTLANELRRRFFDVQFICREHSGHMIHKIEENLYQVYRLPEPRRQLVSNTDADYASWLGVTQEQDAAETLEVLGKQTYDWLIVDHYGLDATWEKIVGVSVKRVLVIDDLANRDHECDLLLDQNYFGDITNSRYRGRVSDFCNCLLGPSYALLQPEYAQLRAIMLPRDGKISRILIFFGGSDLTNQTAKVLLALSMPEFEHLIVDVVIGINHPDPESIIKISEERSGVILHQNLISLAGLMARADLFIGAGGATTWERMSLGLPSLIISVADNQLPFTRALSEDGMQFLLAGGKTTSLSDWQETILEWIQKPATIISQLSQRAESLVDGLGLGRVANVMHEISTKKTQLNYSVNLQQRDFQHLRITILSDLDSWFVETVTQLSRRWISDGHSVRCIFRVSELAIGDVCFILSCSSIIKPEQMALHRHNLVVHAADLPKGRGWSPMTWQILDGKNRICMTLFEAAADVDAGPIYAQQWVELDGSELADEWRAKQVAVTQRLCMDWISGFPESAINPKIQFGEASYYPRRRAEDSRLDPDQSLREQFDILRVVDNQRYPAFFEMNEERYQLLIKKIEKEELQ